MAEQHEAEGPTHHALLGQTPGAVGVPGWGRPSLSLRKHGWVGVCVCGGGGRALSAKTKYRKQYVVISRTGHQSRQMLTSDGGGAACIILIN